MRKLFSIALISVGLSSLASADTFNLHQGWNLVGSSSSVDLSKDFNNSNISVVWGYKNGQWQYFTSSDAIKSQIGNKYTMFTKTSPNEGFWIYAYNPLSINIGNNNQQNSINSNTCNVDFSKVQNLEEPGSIDDINLDELNGKSFDNVDLSKDIFVKNAFVNLTCIKWVFESENGVYSFDGKGNVVIKSSSGNETGTYKIVNLGDNKNILIIEVGNEEHVYVPMWKDESNNGYIGFLFDVKDGNISNINKTKFVPSNNKSYNENDNNSNNYQNNTSQNNENSVDLENFKKYLVDNNLNPINYDIINKTYLIGENKVAVIESSDFGKYHEFDYKKNNFIIHDKFNKITKTDDNIYTIDTDNGQKIVVAAVKNEGNGVVDFAFTTPNGIQTSPVIVLQGNVQDSILNNINNVKSIFKDSNITMTDISEDEIKGEWKTDNNNTLTFSDDGNFSIKSNKGGETKGTYKVEDGGVHIHFDDDGMNVYLIPTKKEDGKILMYAVFSDDDYNEFDGGSVFEITKQ